MKNTLFIFFVSLIIISVGCSVDDYQDANLAPQLNGPYGFVDEVSGVAFFAFDVEEDAYFNYILAGETTTFTIDLVDAPGGLAAAEVSLSNIVQPEDLGVATVSFEGSPGVTKTSLTVTYTPSTEVDVLENLVVTVTDQQDPPKEVVFALDPFKTVDAASCFPTNRDLDGKIYHSATTNIVDTEDDPTAEDYPGPIVRFSHVTELRINSDLGVSHPGIMEVVSDATFGLSELQGFGPLEEVLITICDDEIINADMGSGDFSIFTGSIAEDSTISIVWETTWGDAGTTVLTPCEECSLDWDVSVSYGEIVQ